MTIQPYGKVTVQGQVLDHLTYAAFQVAQNAGPTDDDWTIIKGSYKPDDVNSPSAGTHAGGGAIDITPFNAEQRVRQLRRAGFAAWHRLELPGEWNEHIHCILVGNIKASPDAKRQVLDYINYIDGLAGHDTPDNTWHPFPKGGPPIVFRWNRYENEVLRVEALAGALKAARLSTEKAARNAQNDTQASVLLDQSRALDKMQAEFRYVPELYVETKGSK